MFFTAHFRKKVKKKQNKKKVAIFWGFFTAHFRKKSKKKKKNKKKAAIFRGAHFSTIAAPRIAAIFWGAHFSTIAAIFWGAQKPLPE